MFRKKKYIREDSSIYNNDDVNYVDVYFGIKRRKNVYIERIYIP